MIHNPVANFAQQSLAKHARCDQPSFEQKEKKKVEVDHAKWHLARYKV